ncbi:hypothetical protein F4780DRAFT_206661 [Xylariomycetidae sp. FL0641]|nr:hypothetical protein F4780DRAFT_206661 [Xylariomycetidae sp. FL0641]
MEEQMDSKLLERAKEALEKRIRPREEIVALRRVIAQELAQSLGVEHLSSPLALTDSATEVTPSEVLTGHYREFLEEVEARQKYHQEFTSLQEEHAAAAAAPAQTASDSQDEEAELLELQLEVNALEQEVDRLKILDKHLDELNQMPAAAPDFLDPEVMYKDFEPLPAMPQELMDGFTKDQETPEEHIQELMGRLRKAVVQNKLLEQRDAQKLEELKANHPIDPRKLSPGAQLHALSAVKDALINWIENMLSQAGDHGDEGDEAAGAASPQQQQQQRQPAPEAAVDHEAQLATIEAEYQRHMELRQQIMTSLAQLKQFMTPEEPAKAPAAPRPQTEKPRAAAPAAAAPQAYLLTPYLEKVQALAREQKGLVAEKAHMNAALAKRQAAMSEALGHLEDESQLLAQYPMPGRGGRQEEEEEQSFGEATNAPKPAVLRQLRPWIYAADSAKIATLEAVAEKVDEGHMAVDDAMEALAEVRKLLNKEQEEEKGKKKSEGDDEVPLERDLWMPEDDEKSAPPRPPPKKTTEKQPVEEEKSIWSKLHGDLGLINE